MGVSALTLSNADKLRFAEVEDRITREFGDSDTMDFLEYLKQQDVENDLRQDSLEESIEFLVNECGELQKEVNEYRQQEETKLTEQLQDEIDDLNGEINGLESEISNLEDTISDLESELKEANDKITDLESEIEDLESKIEDMEEQE